MLTWIVLGILAMGGGGYLAYRVGKARGEAERLPAKGGTGAARKERTFKEVQVDDILQQGGRDWLVEGVLLYDEDGHAWRAARTVDAPDERWFVIGMDRLGPTTVRLLAPAAGVDLSGYPPETLQFGGESYTLAKRGTATVVLQGNLGELPGAKDVPAGSSTRCRWWRYAAAGEKTLLVEEWSGKYRALAGASVPADDVDMLSAS
jgi:hypothetical protein